MTAMRSAQWNAPGPRRPGATEARSDDAAAQVPRSGELQGEPGEPQPRGRPGRKPARVIAAALGFTGFFATYLYFGSAIARTGILHYFNVLFQADCPRVIADLTSTDTEHYRTAVHPLFVLFFNPIGVLLARAIGSQELAGRLLCSTFGAATVVLAAEFFIASGLGVVRSWLWACVLGFSSAQLFWASAPESFVFSSAALALMGLVTVVRRDRLAASVAAGVLVLGITLSNFAQAILLFRAGARPGRGRMARVGLFAAVVLGCAIVLSIAQKLLYPTAVWFFVATPYAEDVGYLARLDAPALVAERGAIVADHLVVFNVVAPRPHVVPLDATLTDALVRNVRTLLPARSPPLALTFGANGLATMYREGYMAALLWIVLIVLAVVRARKSRLAPIQSALLLCVAFNGVLHFVYGDALFLYAPDWTFAAVASVALALGNAGGRAGNLALGALIALLASNDLALMRDVVGLYRIRGG